VADGVRYPLELAFELADMGVRMRAERHRREHPSATDAEVDAVVSAWLQERPGAPFGDCDGQPITLPRSS
jgi:Rv0078B-related antitoxin